MNNKKIIFLLFFGLNLKADPTTDKVLNLNKKYLKSYVLPFVQAKTSYICHLAWFRYFIKANDPQWHKSYEKYESWLKCANEIESKVCLSKDIRVKQDVRLVLREIDINLKEDYEKLQDLESTIAYYLNI